MFDWFHNRVPYTDFQQKNLDWLTETVREGEAAVEAKIEEADTAIENAEAATEAANTAKTGADDAATAANNAATAANNAKDAANTAAANAQAAADKWATPYASTTVAGMTDHAKIYVYTGTEVGYTAGNWYYWNGTAWTSGGVYVGDISDAVLFNTAQSKSETQKDTARNNIGVIGQNNIKNNHNLYVTTDIDTGHYYNTSGVYSSNSSFKIVKCPIDESLIGSRIWLIKYGVAGSISPLVFLDSNGDVISNPNPVYNRNFDTNGGCTITTIPSGTKKAAITLYSDAYQATLGITEHVFLGVEANIQFADSIKKVYYSNNGYDSDYLDSKNMNRKDSLFGLTVLKGADFVGITTTVDLGYASGLTPAYTADYVVTLPIALTDIYKIKIKLNSAFNTKCYFCDSNRIAVAVGTSSEILVGDLDSSYKYVQIVVPTNASYTDDTLVTIFYNYDEKDSDKDVLTDAYYQYEGKKGVAFGTSLTYRAQTTGGYLQYLPQMLGMTFDNQGVGSSYIYGASGTYNMLETIKAYTGYADKDVVTIEGFVNDWYNNKTLGSYTDATETSVCGCVRSAINYIRGQNANATVYLILDHYGQDSGGADCSSTATNAGSKTQYEYYEEIAKVAESLGVKVIKLYACSEMSEATPQYYIDDIHPNAKGAKQTANAIYDKMKLNHLNVV